MARSQGVSVPACASRCVSTDSEENGRVATVTACVKAASDAIRHADR